MVWELMNFEKYRVVTAAIVPPDSSIRCFYEREFEEEKEKKWKQKRKTGRERGRDLRRKYVSWYAPQVP